MSEHPILFNAEMVRAILAGRKTQTRRVVKLRGRDGCCSADCSGPILGEAWVDSGRPETGQYLHVPCRCGASQRIHSPWAPGDRLWVRETWRPINDPDLWTCVTYRADGARVKPTDWTAEQGAWCEAQAGDEFDEQTQWRPSIHMPRWASRLTLYVAAVRVERVQQITTLDAFQEGCPTTVGYCVRGGAQKWFRTAWDTINGPRGYGWEANPWVWVVEFRRVEG